MCINWAVSHSLILHLNFVVQKAGSPGSLTRMWEQLPQGIDHESKEYDACKSIAIQMVQWQGYSPRISFLVHEQNHRTLRPVIQILGDDDLNVKSNWESLCSLKIHSHSQNPLPISENVYDYRHSISETMAISIPHGIHINHYFLANLEYL